MATHPIKIIFFFTLFPRLIFSQEVPLFHLVTEKTHAYYGALTFEPDNGLKELQELSLENWQKIIKVYPAQGPAGDYSVLPPMLGTISDFEGHFYFKPRFPFIRGQSYQLFLEVKKAYGFLNRQPPKGIKADYQQLIIIPDPEQKKATFVEKIYPSTSHWPANQLKFYIYFSAPMRFGEAYKYIQLQDENGKVVEQAFLLEGQELWDAERKRLTIWFDPGRIKRGLIPNLKLGPPLEKGKKYSLIVNKEWKGLNGVKLNQSYVKEIMVQPADRELPKPAGWSVLSPSPGTLEPLKLLFDEPMDHALLNSSVVVVDENGQLLDGRIKTAQKEQEWYFYPNLPWKAATYKVRLSHDLEDLAGNNLIRLFDTDTDEPEISLNKESSPYIELPFNVLPVQTKR